MCVYEHLTNLLEGKNDYFPSAEKEFKMIMGSALHLVWQDLLLTTRLLYGQPNYPQIVLDKLEEKVKEGKKVYQYPEIYGYSEEWAISLWIDSVLRDQKELWINDFKSKNMEPKLWDKNKVDFPPPKEECQVYIYACYVDKYNYFDQKTAGVRLSYYNTYAHGHPNGVDPRWEWSSRIDPVKYEKTLRLLTECGNQARMHKEGKGRACTYEDCNKHGEHNSGESSS